jgi:CHASE2 domain-containing sensor protein
MPEQAGLLTFRNKSAAEILAIFKQHSYFRHPKNFSYSAFLFFWGLTVGLLAVLAKRRKEELPAVVSYAAALTMAGLFMMLANCVLTVFQPRFTLPMWELTIVSLSILFAKTMEYFFAGRSNAPQHFARAGGC